MTDYCDWGNGLPLADIVNVQSWPTQNANPLYTMNSDCGNGLPLVDTVNDQSWTTQNANLLYRLDTQWIIIVIEAMNSHYTDSQCIVIEATDSDVIIYRPTMNFDDIEVMDSHTNTDPELAHTECQPVTHTRPNMNDYCDWGNGLPLVDIVNVQSWPTQNANPLYILDPEWIVIVTEAMNSPLVDAVNVHTCLTLKANPVYRPTMDTFLRLRQWATTGWYRQCPELTHTECQPVIYRPTMNCDYIEVMDSHTYTDPLWVVIEATDSHNYTDPLWIVITLR